MDNYHFWQGFFSAYQSLSVAMQLAWLVGWLIGGLVVPAAFLLGLIALTMRYRIACKRVQAGTARKVVFTSVENINNLSEQANNLLINCRHMRLLEQQGAWHRQNKMDPRNDLPEAGQQLKPRH